MREDGIRCVISGDGADESLGGYPTYDVPLGPIEYPLNHHVLNSKYVQEPVTFSRRNMAKRMLEGLHKTGGNNN